MASLEHLDLLIGEALENIMRASNEVRRIKNLDEKHVLMRIGRAVSELWEIRDEIYELKPELKRDFIIEYRQDKQRYETLSDIERRAYEAENNGNINNASNLYQELLSISHYGYFRLLAEAGLYRVSKFPAIQSDHEK